MRFGDELQMLILAATIAMKCIVAAATSRHDVDAELVKVRRAGTGCVDCQSSGKVPTVGGLRSTPTEGDDTDNFQPHHDVNETTRLRRSSRRADPEKIVDRGRPTVSEDSGRRRRSLRPTTTVELAETSSGQLHTLGVDYAERFAFKDPAPHQLDVSAVMGNVLLRDGHRLDYETEPEIEFVVVVTRVDDVACEYAFYLYSGVVCKFVKTLEC